MILTRFPQHAMFALHRAPLDRVARHYYEEVPLVAPPAPPKRIGLHRISRITVTPTRVYVECHAAPAFIYSPPTHAWVLGSERLVPLGGNWYVYRGFEGDILSAPVRYILYRLSW